MTTSPMTDYTPAQIDEALAAASAATAAWSASAGASRAQLLRALAGALQAERSALVPLAGRETGQEGAELDAEFGRTVAHLRGVADRAEAGIPCDDDPAALAPPGPVAVFAAGDSPFAFSVLGGDTAAALAAGRPVVVKAHPGHPELSRAMARLARGTVARLALPEGVFGMVGGAGARVSRRLLQSPEIAAVAATGAIHDAPVLQEALRARPELPVLGGALNEPA